MSESRRFAGLVALVTGGAGDIGIETAGRLAADGATIALLDVKADKLKTAAVGLQNAGAKVKTYECDVTDYDAVVRTVDSIAQELGSVDLLFNNAGYQGEFKPIHEYPEVDFATVIRINLVGAFYVLKAAAVHMVRKKFGRIVNTASMAGVGGPPNMAAYGASKFGIVGLTETAAKDLAPYNIRVNAISPAFMGPGYMWDRQVQLQAEAGTQYFSSDPAVVADQMIGSVPMRRYGNIAEIPGAVVFLMSEEASYITGVNIPIAGGIT